MRSAGPTWGKITGLPLRGVLQTLAGSALTVLGCTIAGQILGFGAARLALEFAEGDARGGEMLVIGFAVICGAGLGVLAGIALSLRWFRGSDPREDRGPDPRP